MVSASRWISTADRRRDRAPGWSSRRRSPLRCTRFRDRVGHRLSGRRPHHQRTQLALEVDELLRDHRDPGASRSRRRIPASAADSSCPHPLAVVAAAGGLGDHRPAVLVAEGRQRGGIGHHPIGRAADTERGQPITHDALSWACTSAAGPGPDRDAVGLQLAQQTGGHVFVVEGHDIAAGGELPDRLRVGVVPHRDRVRPPGPPRRRPPRRAVELRCRDRSRRRTSSGPAGRRR